MSRMHTEERARRALSFRKSLRFAGAARESAASESAISHMDRAFAAARLLAPVKAWEARS